MSLSSLLLSKSKDAELDALFSNVIPLPAAGPSVIKQNKRKNEVTGPDPEPEKKKARKSKGEQTEQPKAEPATPKKSKSKPKLKWKAESNDEDEDAGMEDAYAAKAIMLGPSGDDAEADDSDDEGDAVTLVHESLAGTSSVPKKKVKFVPDNETPEQRNERTIFVGNLPVDVAQKKAGLKQLKRHVLALVPDAKIESVRFRSIPFQTPTSELPDDADEKVKSGKKDWDKIRAHDRERASAWKDDDSKGDEKQFLTPSQKKRIAFINQDFHTTASSTNAYIVFAHIPTNSDASPYEAARIAAEKCNGTTFIDRVIRVDVVGKPDAIGDPKHSVFVGNLDFASKDEDLRAFFEGVMSTERGPPPHGTVWVTRVRIVRDRETQLGKGFAYIQFCDTQCVDEIVALEEGKLRFAKRKLRVARCKSVTAKAAAKVRQPAAAAQTPKVHAPVTVRPGDPSLGDRLAHLSKDARKEAKSSNADRVARRLEKKKARNNMGKDVKARDRVRKKSTNGKPATQKPARRVRSEQSLSKRNTKK